MISRAFFAGFYCYKLFYEMTNKKYTTTTYSVSIDVAKTPDEVFSQMTDLAKWWPEEIEGDSLKMNSEFILRTGEGHFSRNKVLEFVRGRKFTWLVTESRRKSDNFDWKGTKMIFELTPENGITRIKFTYEGVVFEDEIDNLVRICDFVIKEKLYYLLESFNTTIEVTKSPDYVFSCLREVPKWWSKDFEGSSAKLNDEFVIHHPGAHYSKQRLVEVIPGKRIVWLVTESTLSWLQNDRHEWIGTKMIFEIKADGAKTLLHFTHEGLVPDKECYIRCEQGWTMIITERLFNYIMKEATI